MGGLADGLLVLLKDYGNRRSGQESLAPRNEASQDDASPAR